MLKDKSINDNVYHPEHYNHEGRRECWDEMLDIFGPEAVAIFDSLSAYKYQYRKGTKDGNPTAQDESKILNYINHAMQLEQSGIDDYAVEVIRKIEEVIANG